MPVAARSRPIETRVMSLSTWRHGEFPMLKSICKWFLAGGVVLVVAGCGATRPPMVFVDPSYNHRHDALAQQAVRDNDGRLATVPAD